MTRLNLPPFDVKLRGTKEHPMIFDILRKKFIALTPEEWVRQHFVHFLLEHRGYPWALMANEVSIDIAGVRRRCDSVLFNQVGMHPRIVMEYKAPSVAISQKVFDQIAAYNSVLRADYLMVLNGRKHYCCRMDYEKNSASFLQDIPAFDQLV